jgi:hypothetical protein
VAQAAAFSRQKFEGQEYPTVPQLDPSRRGPELGTPSRGKGPKNGSAEELRIKLRHYSGLLRPAQVGPVLLSATHA